ncbi:MAG: sensor histidine kinase [Coriobacteriia bacterium]|nr:sensor histidine kinase [Coriobacteriia bacterium]
MITRLKDRVSRIDPLWLDVALAVGLTALVFLQLYVMHTMHPRIQPGVALREVPGERLDAGWISYALVAASFLPLAVRRKAPWVAFSMSCSAAFAYSVFIPNPAPTILGPMIAIYTVASRSKRRRTGLIAALSAGLVIAAGLFVFSPSVKWVSEVVGPIVVLSATALLGEAERNRRSYVAEVERRALEAERTREEEAHRRVDEERIRIARDVHDIVAHSLSIVTVQASAAATLLDSSPERARESIENIRTTGKQALTELRSMLDVLRTADGAPLAPAADLANVGQLVEHVREAGIDAKLQVNGELAGVPAYAGVSAYRIVQEALTNIVRHAQASHVQVTISAGARDLAIEITDDGKGMDLATADATAGHGIQGMRERVDALGGSFELLPAENTGVRLSVTIPLTRSAS